MGEENRAGMMFDASGRKIALCELLAALQG